MTVKIDSINDISFSLRFEVEINSKLAAWPAKQDTPSKLDVARRIRRLTLA